MLQSIGGSAEEGGLLAEERRREGTLASLLRGTFYRQPAGLTLSLLVPHTSQFFDHIGTCSPRSHCLPLMLLFLSHLLS